MSTYTLPETHEEPAGVSPVKYIYFFADGKAEGSGAMKNESGGGNRRKPATGQRTIRGKVLHAGNDGHHPQPRAQRSERGSAGPAEQQFPVCLRFLPTSHPNVRECGS